MASSAASSSACFVYAFELGQLLIVARFFDRQIGLVPFELGSA